MIPYSPALFYRISLLSVAWNCPPQDIGFHDTLSGIVFEARNSEFTFSYEWHREILSVTNSHFPWARHYLSKSAWFLKDFKVDFPFGIFARFSYAMDFRIPELDNSLSEHEKMEVVLQLKELGIDREPI